MNQSEHTWLDAGIEFGKYVLAGLGTAASSACLYLVARYRGHLAMLVRHEERLNANDAKLGDMLEFRSAAKKGKVGEELESELKKIHRRIGVKRKLCDSLDKRLTVVETAMNAELRNINEALNRIEGRLDNK